MISKEDLLRMINEAPYHTETGTLTPEAFKEIIISGELFAEQKMPSEEVWQVYQHSEGYLWLMINPKEGAISSADVPFIELLIKGIENCAEEDLGARKKFIKSLREKFSQTTKLPEYKRMRIKFA